MGDSQGQDWASISHLQLRSGGALLPPRVPLRSSFREVKQTGRCGASLATVTVEDALAGAHPRGQHAAGPWATSLGVPG